MDTWKDRRSGKGVNDNDHFPFQATGDHKTPTHFSFPLNMCAGSADRHIKAALFGQLGSSWWPRHLRGGGGWDRNVIMTEETGPHGRGDRRNLWERIVQIRPALSVRTHLWPRKPFMQKKKKVNNFLSSLLCVFAWSHCTCPAVNVTRPLCVKKKKRRKSEACVLFELLRSHPLQLGVILQSESRGSRFATAL